MTDVTVTLTGDAAERLTQLVETGAYDSPEAAIADALDALGDPADPELEEGLKAIVMERYDDHVANPGRSVSVAEARRRLLGKR